MLALTTCHKPAIGGITVKVFRGRYDDALGREVRCENDGQQGRLQGKEDSLYMTRHYTASKMCHKCGVTHPNHKLDKQTVTAAGNGLGHQEVRSMALQGSDGSEAR